VQKSAGKFLVSIFWDQDSILLIHYLPMGQTIKLLLISAGVIEGHLEGKTPQQNHQGGLVLARQCPGSPGTCDPEETGLPELPMSLSPTLFSGSGPIGLPPIPWTEKNNSKFTTFRPTRRSLMPRRSGWMDNFLVFF